MFVGHRNHCIPSSACDGSQFLRRRAATDARRKAGGRNNGMVGWKVPARDSCNRCLRKMGCRNNGMVYRKVPAQDSCNRCLQNNGPQEPSPLLGSKHIRGSGVGWLRIGDTQLQLALYASLLWTRGVHRGTQKAQNGNLGQVELENGCSMVPSD